MKNVSSIIAGIKNRIKGYRNKEIDEAEARQISKDYFNLCPEGALAYRPDKFVCADYRGSAKALDNYINNTRVAAEKILASKEKSK